MQKHNRIPIPVAKKRFSRRLMSKCKKKNKRRIDSERRKKIYECTPSIVQLPEILNINTHRGELVKVILDIRKMFSANPNDFILDHSTVEEAEISALLVLASEIQKNTFRKRLKLRSQKKYRPKNPKISNMLEDIGYWKHFGINVESDSKSNDFYLKITDGSTANFKEYTKIRQFYQEHLGIKNLNTIEKLDDAITESIANVVEHAYTVKKILKKRNTVQMNEHWWLCGFYDRTKKILQFICYDQGVGLKAAVNYNDTLDIRRLVKDFVSFSDANVIKTLLMEDLTKYNNKDRGYGFKRFEELIDEYDTGKLEIYSQKGYYCIDKKSGTKTTDKKDYSGAVEGTLISWQLNIEDENEKL